MTSTQERVTMPGVLCGKGRSARCNVSVLRVTLSGTKLHVDCQHAIEWVSQPLPEGVYELSIEGKAIDMRHSGDGWHVVLVRALLSGEGARNRTTAASVRERVMSVAGRKKIADAQRKRWTALKKAAVKK